MCGKFFKIMAGVMVVWWASWGLYVPPSNAQSPTYALLLLADNHETHSLYRVMLDTDGELVAVTELIAADEQLRLTLKTPDYLIFTGQASKQVLISRINGERQLDDDFSSKPSPQEQGWITLIMQQAPPLTGEPHSFMVAADGLVIFSMTGTANPYVNLYALVDDEVLPLTSVRSMVDASAVILSASAEFIAWRPAFAGQFLYRGRVRTADGIDHNQLFIYDLNTHTSQPAPYFGKDPIWTADGMTLIGARLNDAEPPLYELTQVSLLDASEQVIDFGCNPTLTADGQWLVYDGHTTSQWQGYTDCLANGEVHLWHVPTGEFSDLPNDLSGTVLNLGWLKNTDE